MLEKRWTPWAMWWGKHTVKAVGSQATQRATGFAIYTISIGLHPVYIKYQKEKILIIIHEKIESAQKWARAPYGQRRGSMKLTTNIQRWATFFMITGMPNMDHTLTALGGTEDKNSVPLSYYPYQQILWSRTWLRHLATAITVSCISRVLWGLTHPRERTSSFPRPGGPVPRGAKSDLPSSMPLLCKPIKPESIRVSNHLLHLAITLQTTTYLP